MRYKKNAIKKFLLFFVLIVFANISYGQKKNKLWIKAFLNSEKNEFKNAFQENNVYELNNKLLSELLKTSKKISFPNLQGNLETFIVSEHSIMEAGLQNKFSNIKTYVGKSIKNKGTTIRFINSIIGLNAVITNNNGTFNIKPRSNKKDQYLVFKYKEKTSIEIHKCGLETKASTNLENNTPLKKSVNDGYLRKYRLAVSATGEYSQEILKKNQIASNASDETKKEAVLASIVTTILNVNAVFIRDCGISMELVDNNKEIIFLDAENDGFSNYDRDVILNENQNIIDSLIGVDNYDIGHVFANANNGGYASYGGVCNDNKARAVSSSYEPYGTSFGLLVMHEMGHQFGASHTFNGDEGSCLGNRSNDTAVEPGSGTTIMSYSGSCELQNVIGFNEDSYFHIASINQMRAYITSGIGCAELVATGNTAPSINDIPNYTIPISTPFLLDVSASDVDDDDLTYTWEQLDGEIAIAPPISTSIVGPLFRSLPPSTSSKRYFPYLTTVLSGEMSNKWEVLPSVARTIKMGLNVRDNNLVGGQSVSKEILITVDANANPFKITSQNEDEKWEVGTNQTIIWDKSTTNLAPINCSKVNILFSEDGGYTFPIELAKNVDNDGEQEIVVPNLSTGGGKIKIESVGNIFYTINKGLVTINLENKTFIPDDNFEQALINLGYDSGTLDNYVSTSSINTIKTLNISGRNIKDIRGIKDFTALTALNISSDESYIVYRVYNNILSIDLSKLTNLSEFYCSGVNLNSLDISNNKNLIKIDVTENNLKTLNTSENIELKELNCGINNILNLDLTNNISLGNLGCFLNKLTNLNLSNNTFLETLSSGYNSITNLDLSKNDKLTYLWSTNNKLNTLDIKNGNNQSISYFNVTDNPDLVCINVDNKEYATQDWTNIDEQTSFSENCNTTAGIVDVKSSGFLIYPNPANSKLYIQNNNGVKGASIIIYSLLGEKILTETKQANILDIQSLKSGIYILELKIKGVSTFQKIIKN